MESTERLEQAVAAYKGGDAEAFTAIYEESNRYLYTCIRKIMGSNDNAQDIMSDILQDTYVEISRSIGQQREEGRFLAWAGSIAERKCYAWLKKNKKYVLLQEDDDTFETLADSEAIIPEEVMQSREKQKLVREIIDRELSEMQRLCIVAYYYNEQKQSEIAKELGIPENTVKTNLARAKAKIRDGVTDLEKRQNIKLYSVAPLLLLLFKEDVEACVVPEAVAGQVSAAAAAAAKETAGRALSGKAASTAAKTEEGFGKAASTAVKTEEAAGKAVSMAAKTEEGLGKAVSMAAKTKIAAGIAAVAAAGVVGGGIYMANRQEMPEEVTLVSDVREEQEILPETAPEEMADGSEIAEQSGGETEDIFMLLTDDTWEHYYARALLSPEAKYEAFDLHDFDEDGIPELVVKMKNGILDVEGFHEDFSVHPVDADLTGYGEKASELISIYPDDTDDDMEMTMVYVFDDFEMVEMIEPAMIQMPGRNDYMITDSEFNMEEVPFEEAWQRIESWQGKYQAIDFKPLEPDVIVETIEAYSSRGSLLGD